MRHSPPVKVTALVFRAPGTRFFWSAALFALLQFGLLPRMKHAWSRLPLDKQLKRFGVLATLEKVREYSLITAMCLLTFGLVVFFSSSYSGDSSAAISHALLRAQAANEKLKHLKEFWATCGSSSFLFFCYGPLGIAVQRSLLVKH